MKERLFKVSVSDWKIEFDNDETLMLNTLIKETVSLGADGAADIILEDVSFDSKFVDYFKNGINIKSLTQSFNLMSGSGVIQESLEYSYPWVKLVNITIKSEVDSVSVVNINFHCD